MSKLRTILLSVLVLAMTAAPLLAQEGNRKAPDVSPYLTYGLIAVFVGLIVAASLKPSKRGHQD